MVAKNRGRRAYLSGNDHIEQSTAGYRKQADILLLELIDKILSLKLEQRGYDSGPGITRGKAKFPLELRL